MGKSVISHVIPRTYQDSVRLMRISEKLSNLDTIQRSFVAMGTDANKRVLEQIDLLTDAVNEAGANDLIFVIEADSMCVCVCVCVLCMMCVSVCVCVCVCVCVVYG